jgi:hypothetical protein
MKMVHKKIAGLLFALLVTLAVAAKATPIANISAFSSKADGQTVFATDWNGSIGGIYTFINNTLLNATNGLNCLTTKGDFYGYDGTNLGRFPAGTDGQVLTADSTQTFGVKYASLASVSNLTTKGDILGYDTGNNRVPVGTDGQVLTADSAATLGVSYQTPAGVPKGSVIAWSPTAAGTSVIPTGWGLCDGTTQSGTVTPNLIGRFVLGGRPSGSTATGSAFSYNAFTADQSKGNSTLVFNSTTGGNVGAGTGSYNGTATANTAPPIACFVLVYICKLSFIDFLNLLALIFS